MSPAWDSQHHFVGKFWVVDRPPERPEIIAFRAPFSRAEPKGDMLSLPPGFSHEMVWNHILRRGEEGLSASAQEIVNASSHKDWPDGSVVYFINSERWHLTCAAGLVGRKEVIARVQSLFAIDPEHCLVSEYRSF